jgi:hypothetical protein
MSETVVLVEGYHDRAFWKGLLIHLGCEDLAAGGGTSGIRVVDPSGKPVTGGQFAFRSRSGAFVRLHPCNGDKGVLREARIRLQVRATRPIAHLVICLDADVDVGQAVPPTASPIRAVVQKAEPTASPGVDGVIRLQDGTVVSPIYWHTTDGPSDLLPAQQCLERMVVSALASSYPDRAMAVRDWLRSRPSPPADDPKSHAWSYMAGWYPGFGCEAFLTQTWADPLVTAAMRAKLEAAAIWDIIESVAT